MSIVKNGDVVAVHYSGRLTTGEPFDSSEGREPLEFTVGAGQMIPGFDAGVMGMTIGEKKSINIAPEEAYGEWQEENTVAFPKENLPADLQIEIGMHNHMLAGKELVFDIEMVSINGQKSNIILLD
jgi:FKBP-type peptidyl-prolyl cis-trans isomerase 2